MGNSPMTIGLQVNNGNKAGIMAGSILHGRIYLSTNQSVNAHSIRLKLIGTEFAKVHYQTSETRPDYSTNRGNNNESSITETMDHYEHNSHVFYEIDHSIKDFPGAVIPRGQYEFPFHLHLPKSLPSSMEARQNQSHCEVRYEIIAEVYQKPNSLFYKNQHHKELLNVVAMPSSVRTDEDSSLHLPVEIVPVSSCNCCCFASCTKQGTMALESKFDKTTLLLDTPTSPSFSNSPFHRTRQPRSFQSDSIRNQSIGVQFRCENKSTELVKSVRAQLQQKIEWRVNGHFECLTTTLGTSTVDASLYPELNAMWRKPFKFEEHQRNSDMNFLLNSKPWRTIDPPLRVEGAEATDTYRGNCVNVRHVLTLSVNTTGCCSTNPDASALVEIYRNPAIYGVDLAGHEGFTEAFAQDYSSGKPSPTAPFEDEVVPEAHATPTAPSSVYDDALHQTSATAVPMVQAQLVLPDDWNAHTHETVTIPIAEATVVGTSTEASGGRFSS